MTGRDVCAWPKQVQLENNCPVSCTTGHRQETEKSVGGDRMIILERHEVFPVSHSRTEDKLNGKFRKKLA